MKKKQFAVFLFAFLLFSFPLVMAADAPNRIFSQMDTDKDGEVTKDEFMAYHMKPAEKMREARFNQLDTNDDGKITKDEFMAVHLEEARKTGEWRFNKIDVNKDGVLSQDEVTKRFNLVKQSLEQVTQ